MENARSNCRTLPNTKKSKKYSHTNPPYFEDAALSFMKANSTFIIDLPSVDKEKDEGNFSSQSFLNVTDVNQFKQDARLNATITEMILQA
jgi:hypothetical protein